MYNDEKISYNQLKKMEAPFELLAWLCNLNWAAEFGMNRYSGWEDYGIFVHDIYEKGCQDYSNWVMWMKANFTNKVLGIETENFCCLEMKKELTYTDGAWGRITDGTDKISYGYNFCRICGTKFQPPRDPSKSVRVGKQEYCCDVFEDDLDNQSIKWDGKNNNWYMGIHAFNYCRSCGAKLQSPKDMLNLVHFPRTYKVGNVFKNQGYEMKIIGRAASRRITMMNVNMDCLWNEIHEIEVENVMQITKKELIKLFGIHITEFHTDKNGDFIVE